MRPVLILAALLALSASGAYAKSCKESTTGKFINCPAATATATTATMPLLTLLLKEGSACKASIFRRSWSAISRQ